MFPGPWVPDRPFGPSGMTKKVHFPRSPKIALPTRTWVAPNAIAVETDLLEQPLASNTASLCDGVLSVTIPPFGIATVCTG